MRNLITRHVHTRDSHTWQPFTPTTDEDEQIELLPRKWLSTRYPARPLSVSGYHPLASDTPK
uniref:Uncharacterized protein n=1 Tax=Arundo donax TaxID=35708 RepID=A0A0A9D918_ARUDO